MKCYDNRLTTFGKIAAGESFEHEGKFYMKCAGLYSQQAVCLSADSAGTLLTINPLQEVVALDYLVVHVG